MLGGVSNNLHVACFAEQQLPDTGTSERQQSGSGLRSHLKGTRVFIDL